MSTAGPSSHLQATAATVEPEPMATAQEAVSERQSLSLRHARPVWLRLTVLLLLMALEIGALTAAVEFTTGPMSVVADSMFLIGAMVAGVGFMILVSTSYAEWSFPGSHRRLSVSLAWLAVHLTLFVIFFGYTLWLQGHDATGGGTWGHALAWLGLAFGVAASAMLFVLPAACLISFVKHFWKQVWLAMLLAVVMIWLTPVARNTWTSVDGPAVDMVEALIAWYPGDPYVRYLPDDRPVVGTRGMALVVTPHCSELEIILAFLLLSATMVLVYGSPLRSILFLAMLIVGIELLYFLNVLRLYFLVLFGVHWSPQVSVSLAHSRIGGIILLAAAVLILLVAERLMALRQTVLASKTASS